MKLTTLTLALSALTFLPTSAVAGETWQADFDVAAKLAKEQGKDLFVDFTGSDWCGWCIKLHEEVFDHAAFLDAAQKQYILVALDFPNSDEAKAKVPNPERNAELAKKYKIGGYPTILLMTADGEVFGQTGYQAGGPEKYIEHITKLRADGLPALVETKKVVAAFEAADEAGKLAAWEAVMTLFEGLPDGSALVSSLVESVRWGLEVDPLNEKGLKMRALKALLGTGQADEALMEAARELDPKNEEGLLEQVIEAQFMAVRDNDSAIAAGEALDALAPLGFKDKKIGFRLNFTMCQWCAQYLEDPAGVKKYGEAAKAIGTDEQEMLDYLEKLLAEQG